VTTATSAEYGIGDAARFLGRKKEWVRWRERSGAFVHEDGTPIKPERTQVRTTGSGGHGYRRYTLDDIQEMALSLHRREIINKYELQAIQERIDAFKN